MIVSKEVRGEMEQTGWIRKMFEEGIAMKKQHGSENVFDFSLGNPDIEPPEQLQKMLADMLTNPVPGIHRYMPNNGIEDVRQEIAHYATECYGMPFTSQHIFMSAGSAGGLNILLKSILNRGDEVIVPEPYFVEYQYYVSSHGGVLRTIPVREDFQLDIENLRNAINNRTRIILINSPNNPTGVIYTDEILQQMAELLYNARKRGEAIYLISDDAYRKLVYDNITLPNIFQMYDLTLSVTSHSKDLALPGERIGYIAISPRIPDGMDLIPALMFASRALGFVNAPALFQSVVGKFQYSSVNIKEYEEKRNILYDAITGAGFECVRPTGAFYMFPKSPLEDELEFVRALQQEEKILVVPGRGFGKPGYFRIAYCVPFPTIYGALDGIRRIGKRYIHRKG